MYATTEGTTRYIHRFPRYRDAATSRQRVPENLGGAHVALLPRSLDSTLPQTRSLTVGALIGAPTVREGLCPIAQLVGHQPYLRLYQ